MTVRLAVRLVVLAVIIGLVGRLVPGIHVVNAALLGITAALTSHLAVPAVPPRIR